MRINNRGVTLTELMVAVMILSIGVLGFFGAFRFVTKSLYVSRTRTLATNLAQERIEALKNLTYYELLITTPAFGVQTAVTPNIVYDQNNYTPETIKIGGVSFTRYTYVAMAQIDNDSISTVTWTYPDTGMKQLTVTVMWEDAGVKKTWSLSNLFENPNVNPLDGGLYGYVHQNAGTAMQGANVKVEQNPDWNAVTDVNGYYSFRVYHGSYTVRASSAGWFDNVSQVTSVAAGSTVQTTTITMTRIGSGTVVGQAWYNPNLVIAGVQGTSSTWVGNGAGGMMLQTIEYVELFNPSTATISITAAAGVPKYYLFNVFGKAGGDDVADAGFAFTYVSTAVQSRAYYLIANTSWFLHSGSWHRSDAYYSGDYIKVGECTTVQLTDASGGVVDAVGWDGTGGQCNGSGRPINFKGTVIPLASVPGIGDGNQIVRVSSPAASLADIQNFGRAYDSGSNAHDFVYPTIAGYTGVNVPPKSTRDGQQTVITGKPAYAAYVSAGDPYSGSTQAYTAYVTSGSLSLPVAKFSLVGVATTAASCTGGYCWDVVVTSNSYFAQISTVNMQQGQTISIPHATTVPSWSASGWYHVQLASSSVGGFVAGRVTNGFNQAIPGISISPTSKLTNASGNYFAPISSGAVALIANANNQNSSYVEQISLVNVETGQIVTQNFNLTQGGTLYGYLTSGTSPLPNYIVTAQRGDGSQAGTGTSNTSGYFYIKNMSTGTYTAEPALELGQDSAPNAITVTVTTPGSTVFVGTFTVSGAYGEISGNITYYGNSLTSGALILASTGAIPSTPSTLVASSTPAQAPMYAISSLADGTYKLPVRGGSTYYISAYIPTINNNGTVSVTTKTYSGLLVQPSTTKTQHITVP
jgi:prepilin-type N-terminal cleavage/methylation domain-containing protein